MSACPDDLPAQIAQYWHDVPEGYCPWCCLPLDKDPGHQPWGYENREKRPHPQSPDWNNYMEARREQYEAGLRSLTKVELRAMPKPKNSKWRHQLWKDALEFCNDVPIPTAWDRLNADENEDAGTTVGMTVGELKQQIQEVIDKARHAGITRTQVKMALRYFRAKM